MKTTSLILSIFYLAVGCTVNETLDREEAFRQIQQGKQYPRVIEYDIYCGDPQHAKKVLEAGLEKAGLVRVTRTRNLGAIGSPLIHLTDKAQPFVRPTPEKEKSSSIQRVKLGEEQLIEVTEIITGQSGKEAVVEYTTSYKDLTPFSILASTNYKQKAARKANFSLHEDGWKLEQ